MDISEKKVKKKPTKIEDMTKEQIRETILKKRECNAKAQKIVESLLELYISKDYFLQSLTDINQSHLEDVFEERAITGVCGYPLCCNDLSSKDIPKQMYRISLKTNKVYDITARKSFCSNTCFKCAMHVKNQLLTSPLWFREFEEIPKFQLLDADPVGSLGQEVDVSLVDKIKVKHEKAFTSINDFASATLNEMDDTRSEDVNNATEDNNDAKSKDDIKTDKLETIKDYKINDNSKPIKLNQDHNKMVSNPLNIVGDIVEKPPKNIDPLLLTKPDTVLTTNINETTKLSKTVISKKQTPLTALTIEVEKCLADWLTIDSLLLLFGDEKVKEMLADKGECIKEYLNNYSRSVLYNSNNYDQYQALCRKLNMLELEDKRFDAQTAAKESKPLPDYSILQQESKNMQLKVKSFLTGDMVIPEVVENNDTNTEDDNPDNGLLTQLPLVDKNAQNALRRRIVCEQLNKVLPDILKSLGLLSLTIASDVRILVNTFKLKADNIMFKPIQWGLIAIIIIKLLSIRNKQLEYLLEQPTAYDHLQLLLLSYKQDGGYLDRLVSWLTDIDRLLDTNDTHLTIE